MYLLPTPGPRTSGGECSSPRGLLPAPDLTHGRTITRTGPGLHGIGHLLATPNARDWKGPALPNWTRQKTLPNDIELLRTPTAQLAANGGSQHPAKRRAGGHGPTLADEIEHLLPAPNTLDSLPARSPGQVRVRKVPIGGPPRNLRETVVNELPRGDLTPPL